MPITGLTGPARSIIALCRLIKAWNSIANRHAPQLLLFRSTTGMRNWFTDECSSHEYFGDSTGDTIKLIVPMIHTLKHFDKS